MAKRTQYHVTYNKQTQDWVVKKANADRASARFDTQAEAINAARGFAENNQNSQVLIHRKDNAQIRSEATYGGKDPFPPAG